MESVTTEGHEQLKVTQLTIEYSSGGYAVRPIDGLTLDVPTGSLVLLLGASGCGKTTLLSSMAGILKPTAGRIELGTTEVTALGGVALSEYRLRKVAVVFQAFNLLASLSALENVMVPMRLAGIPVKTAKVRGQELLEQIDLAHRMEHKPNDLSGGQQQRVAIARALAMEPSLILADEPTAHLDYIQVEGVIALLRTLAQPGRIVVVSTHDERLLPLADQVVELTPHAAGQGGPPESVELRAGEVLFRQGEPGERVYVVQDGEIALVRELSGQGEEVFAVARAGDYFGELSPMFQLPRSATARARSDTRLTSYALRDFREVLPTLRRAADATEDPAPATDRVLEPD